MPTSLDDKSASPGREPSDQSKSRNPPAPKTRRPCRRRITRPEPGSLYDILHEHAGTALYVAPICWTDLHCRLLGAHFTARPAIAKPVPDLVPGRCFEPSKMAQTLTAELHTLAREDATPARAFCKNRAIKHVMSTLFPATLSRPKTGTELNLFFGTRLFRKLVRIPCMWKSPSAVDTSFDSCPTVPSTSFAQTPRSSREPGMPLLAYINRTQLAAVRKNLYSVPRDPETGAENEPVTQLQQRRCKRLVPADPNHDPYIVAILLAMAQAHSYIEPSSPRPSSQASSSQGGSRRGPIYMSRPIIFRDVKVQVITHDEGNDSNPNFVVYTATVTAEFLNRFMEPHKAPDAKDLAAGVEITYTPVPFWPVLGLKERLSRALGHEIAPDSIYDDPDYIGLWGPLLQPQPRPFRRPAAVTPSKRRRMARNPLSQVFNSSFESEPPSSSDDRPVLSPAPKRRRTTQTPVSTLEVW